MTDTPDVTQLLRQVSDGDEDALARLIPVVYRELRSLARAQRRKGTSDTLNTTAIVHEAYERLVRSSVDYASRNHFFHVAARVMRGVIIDNARKYLTDKRGSGQRPLPLDEAIVVPDDPPERLVALDDALTELEALSPRQAQIVELRYFVGLTIPETAEVMDLSEASVKRDWTAARAWLHKSITGTA
ncbi:MAG: sigma-70 family RNA polymerase sigma factor [Bacteroidetes bacterium]|nr:sigma-70 family RNA polymerase sigma factor [Bacteroidota bacterium]